MLNTEAEHNQHNYYSESKRIKIKDDLMDMSSSSSNNIPIQPGNLKYNSDLTRWGHIYEVFDGNSTNAVFIVKKGTKDQVRKAFEHYNKNKDNQNVNNYLMDFVLYIDQKGSIKNEEDTISEWMSEYEKVGYFPDEVKTELGILTTSTYNDDKEDTNHDVSIGSNSNRKKPKTREEEAYDLAFAQAKRIEENVKWIDAEIKKTEDKLEKATSNYNEFIQEYTSLPSFVKNSWKTIEEYYDHFKTKNTNLKTELKEAENKLEKAKIELKEAKIELKEANERMDKANSRLDNLQTASATTSFTPNKPRVTPIGIEEFTDFWMSIKFPAMPSIYNDEKLRHLLGPLYKEGQKFPIREDKIDMKYFSSLNFEEKIHEAETNKKTNYFRIWPSFGHSASSAKSSSSTSMEYSSQRLFDKSNLRPAAAMLDENIKSRNIYPYGGMLIAVSGSGKTSSLFEVAHLHFMIYFQCTTAEELSMRNKRVSFENDQTYLEYSKSVMKACNLGGDKSVTMSQAKENWAFASKRAVIELIARLCILCRMAHEREKKEAQNFGLIVTPWEFLVQQQFSDMVDFIGNIVDKLNDQSFEQLNDLFESLVTYLRQKNIIGDFSSNDKPKFMVAIDEIEEGLTIGKGCFCPPEATDFSLHNHKGVVSPLLSTAHSLQYIAPWAIVATGTGSAHERVENLKSGIGKGNDTSLYQSDFPMASPEACLNILSMLNLDDDMMKWIEEEKQNISGNGVKSTASSSSSTDEPLGLTCSPSLVAPAGDSWSELVKSYLYNARFRLLTRTIEEIPNVLKKNNTGDESKLDKKYVLKVAIQRSVNKHKSTLKEHLKQQINERAQNKESLLNKLAYLADISLSSRFSDGKIEIPMSNNIEDTEKDLTVLGIAASVVDEYEKRVFGISERFVLDTIDELCAEDSNAELLAPIQMRLLIRAGYAATTESARGFIVERILLQSLVEMHKKLQGNDPKRVIPVSKLPFMNMPMNANEKNKKGKEEEEEEKRYVELQKNGWENVKFIANYIKTHAQFGFIKNVIESIVDKDYGVIISPGNVSRAGILMLDENHAITLGSKFYSYSVSTAQAISQYRSCDMSRQYLGNDNDIPSDKKKRDDWVEKNLHLVQAVRILFTWPNAVKGAYNDENLNYFKYRIGKHLVVELIRDQVVDDTPTKIRYVTDILPSIRIRIDLKMEENKLELISKAVKALFCTMVNEPNDLNDILIEREGDIHQSMEYINYVVCFINNKSNMIKLYEYLNSKAESFEYVDEMNMVLQKMNGSEKTTYLSGSIKIDKSLIKYQEQGKMKVAEISLYEPPKDKSPNEMKQNSETSANSKLQFKEIIHIFDIVNNGTQDCVIKLDESNIKYLIGGSDAFFYSSELYEFLNDLKKTQKQFPSKSKIKGNFVPKMDMSISISTSLDDAIDQFLRDN